MMTAANTLPTDFTSMNYDMMNYSVMDSPLGPVLITASEAGIHHILFTDMREVEHLLVSGLKLAEHPLIATARKQLEEYFVGQRRDFDLPLAAAGTPFQKKVWAQLATIPYASTWSYVELAHAIQQPTAARAVGMANGKNPLGIVVPCHRVIGKNRQLTGYAGGLERKAWLLEHEAQYRS